MNLVVDTNILVSFFRENPVNKIILISKSINLDLISPDYCIEELRKNKKDILNYSGLDESGFNNKLKELFNIVKSYANDFYKEFEAKARRLIHEKDIPIFALALKLRCPIWSNEPDFKNQKEVKVFDNRDMIELFS